MLTLADAIRASLELQHWPATVASMKADIPYFRFRRLLDGRAQPTATELARLCRALPPFQEALKDLPLPTLDAPAPATPSAMPDTTPPRRRRGRPLGVKNRPKAR